jgi:hypothetical protein
MTPANTRHAFRLPSHSGWRHVVSATVAPSGRTDGNPWTVTILEVVETTERDPKSVVRTLSAADFLALAERDGVYAADVEGKLVDKFVAANEPKRSRKVA